MCRGRPSILWRMRLCRVLGIGFSPPVRSASCRVGLLTGSSFPLSVFSHCTPACWAQGRSFSFHRPVNCPDLGVHPPVGLTSRPSRDRSCQSDLAAGGDWNEASGQESGPSGRCVQSVCKAVEHVVAHVSHGSRRGTSGLRGGGKRTTNRWSRIGLSSLVVPGSVQTERSVHFASLAHTGLACVTPPTHRPLYDKGSGCQYHIRKARKRERENRRDETG